MNADEVLASLDGDTRAYLQILLSAGGTAFDDHATGASSRFHQTAEQDLRETLKRFEPTARNGERFTRLLIARRHNITRVIHNFQLLSTALAHRDRQLAGLVDSANANFQAFASEQDALRGALREFPSALSQTNTTLRKAGGLANELGPALRGCGRSPASWRRRCARRGRSSGRPRRSSATRSARSRVTSSRPSGTCATRAPTCPSSHRASHAASRC